MRTLKIFALALVVVFALLSCDQEKKADLEMNIGDTEISIEITDEMDSFEERFKELGEAIDRKIEQVDERAEEASEEMKEELETQRKVLLQNRKELNDKFSNFRENAKDNWDSFKSDAQTMFKQLEEEVSKK